MDFFCRPFDLKDIDAFERIEIENLPPETRFSKKRIVDILSRDDIVCYSYLADEKVIGYFMLQVDTFQRQANIIEINVDKQHQRIGIGSHALNLIQEVSTHMRLDKIVAQFEKSRSDLHDFFSKGDYKQTKEYKDYLQAGGEGVELEKVLSSSAQ